MQTVIEAEDELVECEAYVSTIILFFAMAVSFFLSQLKAMDVELRSVVSSEKKNASIKIMEYKEEFRNITIHFTKAKDLVESSYLMSSAKAIDADKVKFKETRGNRAILNATNSLEQSRQIVSETEEIGTNIISGMRNQREQLIVAADNVSDTRNVTQTAKSVLSKMGNKAFLHKLSLIGIIIILACLITLVVYNGFIR